MSASKTIVEYGGSVTLTGELTSADGTCRVNEKVDIMRQVIGEEELRKAGGGQTGDLGEFEDSAKVQASAVYTAVAPETRDAAEVVSAPITVLGRVNIEARSRSLTPERGTKFEITAKVQPEHPGSSAVLERKNDAGKWFKVKKDKADSQSSFSFKLKANWKGKRVFRVTWLKSDEDHEPASSNRLKIKPVKPRDEGGRGPRPR